MRRTLHPVIWSVFVGLSSLASGCSGTGSAREKPIGTSAEALIARPSARLVLSDSVLQKLQQRAAAGDAAWTALAQRCDGYATGTMNPPNGNAYPDYPDVGQGYQGEDYLPVIRALGLCYRTTTDANAKARYGAAGGRLLDAMSTPVGSGGQAPSTDSGYGIRNYVVGMAFGYDWLYPALSSSTKSGVISSMNAWIDWYDQSGFINNDPIGNYFAGYFLAKVTAALATEGDNDKASTYWDDVVNRMWGKLVQPEFSSMMAGGGWPEGWGYGRKSVLEMVEALSAVKTAKNLDWGKELPLAHDEAAYLMHFAWPSLKHMDDQGTIRSGITPKPSAELLQGIATTLEASGDSFAAVARGFAADVIATDGDDSVPWSKFLYGDPSMPKANYKTQGLSHLAAGPGHVGMRSSWDTGAVWAAFSGGPYIDAGDSGEQLFDAGSISVVVGDQPVLINPTGWLPQNDGTAGENLVYDDSYGTKQRKLYNTFFVDDASNPYNPGQNSLSPPGSSAHIAVYEDRGGFVHARATGLGDQYGVDGAHPVSQFTRDVVYLRPDAFVLFDRTTVAQASADQWLSFYTPVAPRQATATDSTQRRFDVVVGSVAVGSIRTLLPQNATPNVTSLPASAGCVEVHAPVRTASEEWLTVVTANSSTGDQVRLSAADGNVTSGNLVGVALGAPENKVVLFSSDQAATTTVTSAAYSVPQATADHVLVDVAPSSSGYAVTATPTGGKLQIRVSAGGPYQVSAAKTLAFTVTATGTVSAWTDPSTAVVSSPTTAPTTSPTTAPTTSPTTAPTTSPTTAPTTSPTTAPTTSPTTAPTTSPTTAPTTSPTTAPSSDAQTVTFTQGVNGYSGVEDATISSLYYSSSSNPNGTTFETNDVLYVYALDYVTRALIRFDLSSIPSGATVVSAALDVTIESWTSPQTVLGAFVRTPWNYSDPNFGWTETGFGTTWSAPGMGLADIYGPAFQFSGIDSSGYQRKSVALDPTNVQRWVHDAATNLGVVIANQDSGKVLRISSSEASDVAQRPTLTVTYH